MVEPTRTFAKIQALEDGLNQIREKVGSGDGGGTPDMNAVRERVARLEGLFEGFPGTVEGLRHTQAITLASVLGVGAILASLGIYIIQKIDSQSVEFLQMNTALSAAITAAKQTPPQILVMPPASGQPPSKPR